MTLVELMVVVAILAIVTTVAIPGLRNAKMRANEASAIASLKNLITAQSQYRLRYGSYGTLADVVTSGLLDDGFSDNQKAGFVFAVVTAPNSSSWDMRADPETPGLTGDRFFFADVSGVIRYRDSAPAGATDLPIE